MRNEILELYLSEYHDPLFKMDVDRLLHAITAGGLGILVMAYMMIFAIEGYLFFLFLGMSTFAVQLYYMAKITEYYEDEEWYKSMNERLDSYGF